MIKITIEGETVKEIRQQLEAYLEQVGSNIASEETVAEAAKPAKKAAPKKAETKKAEPKKAEAKDETVPEGSDAAEIDANGLKAKCNDFLAAGGQDDLKQIFSDFGAAKFGEIKAEDFGKVAAAIDKKMAESE